MSISKLCIKALKRIPETIFFWMLLFSGFVTDIASQEKIFANYFDILTGSPGGSEVIGRIHLERNKDVLTSPVPGGYHFEITAQPSDLIEVKTHYDEANRIMGILSVKAGMAMPAEPCVYPLSVVLLDRDTPLNRFDVSVKVVDKTLWQTMYDRYKGFTLDNSRLYGRNKMSDAEIGKRIIEIEQNEGYFMNFPSYTTHPADYLKQKKVKGKPKRGEPTIENEWQEITNIFGGMGYAYAKSAIYGPKGDPGARLRLKRALYKGLRVYMNSVPVEGSDLLIGGKPIGNHTGDGFSLLLSHHLSGVQTPTHQWNMTDALVTPTIHLMPDLLKDIKNGDQEALDLYHANIRYFQLFFSIVERRRPIDDPDNRWGEIQDTLYSSGAWSDANLGHRLRTMLALPILWADYNRPLTYVPYWYSSFYGDKPFANFSFSPGWSPGGVVADVARWLTKFNVPAHRYIQSGFHPDGTVSHHTGHGSDAAIYAYGFEWLTQAFVGFNVFKDTDYRLKDEYYQFPLDRLLHVYPKLFYKNQMDFLVTGRSYLSDMKKFVTGTYLNAVDELLAAKSADTKLQHEDKLIGVAQRIKAGSHEYSGTEAFWVNEYLVHRRGGAGEKPFFASVKLKSARTVGAEDFDKVRKSWHCGSGVLLLKVTGDEYTAQTLKNMDFHMLPGITEEWRTDPMPAEGGSQAALPGQNTVAGVLSDGKSGMAVYHHLPQEKYSSATALKTYHFVEDKIMAVGSSIARYAAGDRQPIFTCLDQSAFVAPLTYSINGKVKRIAPNESVALQEEISSPCWLHINNKGYLVYPVKKQQLVVKTGKEIHATDVRLRNSVPNFIIAVNHGLYPEQASNNSYFYMMIPNVAEADMPGLAEKYAKEIRVLRNEACGHALYASKEKISQFAFFKPGVMELNSCRIAADKPAMVLLSEEKEGWELAVGNPEPDINKQQLTLKFNIPLKEGKYPYTIGGIYPRAGEFVTVRRIGKETVVVVELPDVRDEARYNYQSALYSAAPVVVHIPK